MDALDILRRSRAHKRSPLPIQLDVQPLIAGIENASNIDRDPNYRRSGEKRMTPEEVKAIQASMSQSVARAVASASQARAAGSSSPRQGANAATIGTTISRLDQTQAVDNAPVIRTTSSTQAAAATSATPSTTSTTTSSTSTTPSSTLARSSSTSSSVQSTSTSTTQVVLTVTTDRASSLTSSSSASALATIAAASASASTTGLGTGPIIGIVAAAIVGVVVVGSAAGWLYRKHTARSYAAAAAPWSKLDDTDVHPYSGAGGGLAGGRNNQNEKPSFDDDIYGESAAPVIGSRRALAMARQNAFHADGSARPDSDYMIQRDGNRAGWGAGAGASASLGQYSAYPDLPPSTSGTFGYDAQGRPYNPQAGRVPTSHQFDGLNGVPPPAMAAFSPPGSGTSRQLLGPGHLQQQQPYHDTRLVPIPMGKPHAPTSNNDIADLEEFADVPDAQAANREINTDSLHSTSGLAYTESEPDYTPRTATTIGEWAGDARPLPRAPGQTQGFTEAGPLPAKSTYEYLAPSPVSSSIPQPQPLPTHVPVSPLMSSFGGLEQRKSVNGAAPLGPLAASFASKYGPNANATPAQEPRSRFDPMYADEDPHSRQKRMYSEVSEAAGFPEPKTPHTPVTNLNASTTSTATAETSSSFSAHAPTHSSYAQAYNYGPNQNSSPAPAYTPGVRLPLPPMPKLNLSQPKPYQHGQPLSPLPEVATPASSFANLPVSSSSLNHGQSEINPFDHLHSASSTSTRSQNGPTLLTPALKRLSGGHLGLPPVPYSAASSTGATVFPSPRFPPPSPGGMSVPGSISDSPIGGRRVSFDEDDAYGGI